MRDTEDIIEKAGVERTFDRIETADLVLAVFDSSTPLSDTDHSLIEKLKNRPVVAVINKTDLKSNIDKLYLYNNFHIFRSFRKTEAKLTERRRE